MRFLEWIGEGRARRSVELKMEPALAAAHLRDALVKAGEATADQLELRQWNDKVMDDTEYYSSCLERYIKPGMSFVAIKNGQKGWVWAPPDRVEDWFTEQPDLAAIGQHILPEHHEPLKLDED